MPETAERLNRVSLERGAQATTAIEGNTLSLDEVARLRRGELRLPPSKAYLGVEVDNVLRLFGEMTGLADIPPLSVARLKYLNAEILRGLTLDDAIALGRIRAYEVGVARYRGAPARDCEYLLGRLCDWLNGMARQLGHSELALPIVKAIVAHLYLLWIHPFGDGNGRVARMMEYQILLSAGVPNPATHLLSNHYNETRTDYYRALDRSSRERDGVMGFLVYALQGFVDGLTEQIKTIKDQIREDTWTNYVRISFGDRPSAADTRRIHLVLALSERGEPVRRRDIRLLTPRLAASYATKTDKTITRDLNALAEMGLITRTRQDVSANERVLDAFTGQS